MQPRCCLLYTSTIVISTVCSAILGLSLLAGVLIRPFVPGELVKAVCFFILLALGLVKVFDSSLKAAIRRRKHIHRDFTFSALHLNFILTVYADPEQADQDRSRLLSPAEAFSLAVALSLDGLAVGFGAALGSVGVWQSLLFSLFIGAGAVRLGAFLGNRLASRTSLDLSWIEMCIRDRAGTSRGTGGMFTKVSAAAMANEKGIPCCVMSGATPANLYRLFDGEQIGTIFGTK